MSLSKLHPGDVDEHDSRHTGSPSPLISLARIDDAGFLDILNVRSVFVLYLCGNHSLNHTIINKKRYFQLVDPRFSPKHHGSVEIANAMSQGLITYGVGTILCSFRFPQLVELRVSINDTIDLGIENWLTVFLNCPRLKTLNLSFLGDCHQKWATFNDALYKICLARSSSQLEQQKQGKEEKKSSTLAGCLEHLCDLILVGYIQDIKNSNMVDMSNDGTLKVQVTNGSLISEAVLLARRFKPANQIRSVEKKFEITLKADLNALPSLSNLELDGFFVYRRLVPCHRLSRLRVLNPYSTLHPLYTQSSIELFAGLSNEITSLHISDLTMEHNAPIAPITSSLLTHTNLSKLALTHHVFQYSSSPSLCHLTALQKLRLECLKVDEGQACFDMFPPNLTHLSLNSPLGRFSADDNPISKFNLPASITSLKIRDIGENLAMNLPPMLKTLVCKTVCLANEETRKIFDSDSESSLIASNQCVVKFFASLPRSLERMRIPYIYINYYHADVVFSALASGYSLKEVAPPNLIGCYFSSKYDFDFANPYHDNEDFQHAFKFEHVADIPASFVGCDLWLNESFDMNHLSPVMRNLQIFHESIIIMDDDDDDDDGGGDNYRDSGDDDKFDALQCFDLPPEDDRFSRFNIASTSVENLAILINCSHGATTIDESPRDSDDVYKIIASGQVPPNNRLVKLDNIIPRRSLKKLKINIGRASNGDRPEIHMSFGEDDNDDAKDTTNTKNKNPVGRVVLYGDWTLFNNLSVIHLTSVVVHSDIWTSLGPFLTDIRMLDCRLAEFDFDRLTSRQLSQLKSVGRSNLNDEPHDITCSFEFLHCNDKTFQSINRAMSSIGRVRSISWNIFKESSGENYGDIEQCDPFMLLHFVKDLKVYERTKPFRSLSVAGKPFFYTPFYATVVYVRTSYSI